MKSADKAKDAKSKKSDNIDSYKNNTVEGVQNLTGARRKEPLKSQEHKSSKEKVDMKPKTEDKDVKADSKDGVGGSNLSSKQEEYLSKCKFFLFYLF